MQSEGTQSARQNDRPIPRIPEHIRTLDQLLARYSPKAI
jgi:hypothetical protein